MNSSIILGERDRSTLSALFHHLLPGLIPHPQAYGALSAFLSSARITGDEGLLESHISLGDQVILCSSRGSRAVRIVLPTEAQAGTEKISVLSPMGLSILGRKVGSKINWQSSAGQQPLVIREVLKDSLMPSCTP